MRFLYRNYKKREITGDNWSHCRKDRHFGESLLCIILFDWRDCCKIIMTWKFRRFPRVNISVQIIFIIRTKNRETLNFHVIMIKILTDTHGIFPQTAVTASLVLLQILSWKLGYHSVHSWFFCSSFAVRLRTVSTMRTVRQCSDMWSVRINRTVLSVRIC